MADGDLILIYIPDGRIRILARVAEDVMPGVVPLTEGVWPEFDPEGMEIAGSANVPTSATFTLPGKGSRTHSVQVEAVRIGSSI